MEDATRKEAACRRTCWIAAAMLGVVAAMLVGIRFGGGWTVGIIAGLVVFGVIAWLLLRFFCSGFAEHAEMAAARESERAEARRQAVAEARASATGRAAPSATPETAPEPAAAPEPAPVAEAEEAPAEGGEGPELLSAPRGGKADDLKQIKGVGPKLEKMLNEMGIWHFDQIASWTDAEIDWVDARLEGFKGRIRRDNWVAQAAELARGGETEFSARVKKGEVYRK